MEKLRCLIRDKLWANRVMRLTLLCFAGMLLCALVLIPSALAAGSAVVIEDDPTPAPKSSAALPVQTLPPLVKPGATVRPRETPLPASPDPSMDDEWNDQVWDYRGEISSPREEQPVQEQTYIAPYYLKVNVSANTVTVYSADEDGNYTQPYMAMICSTGAATPWSGVYRLGYRWSWLALFGNVYGQYVTQITGNILFHSVPYLVSGDKSSLEYWEFDQLGTSCSMGCVRLQVCDAQWIYYNRDLIAGVEFYSSSDPGPLGKPSAPLISDNERCRGWDPTDPDPGNPWRSEPEPEESPEPTETPTPEESPTPEAGLAPAPDDSVILVDPEPEPEPTPEPEPEPTPETDIVIEDPPGGA